ncbi:MAG: peptidoglycan-binding protein [bacterium]
MTAPPPGSPASAVTVPPAGAPPVRAGADSVRAPGRVAPDSTPAAPVPFPKDVRWKRAFVAGGVARQFADSRSLNAGSGQPAELYAALEGESGGLPIYCCMLRTLRVDGRAIPDRLVFDPEAAGIASAEIEWTELQPAPDASGWRRTRLPTGRNQWALPLRDFSSDPSTNVEPDMGTARFAVSVQYRDTKGMYTTLTSDGWSPRPDWADPRNAPGFRVTRDKGRSLYGRVFGLARLPFFAGATNEHAWAKVALRPSDLFVAAYEDFAGGPFPAKLRSGAVDGPEWSWLLDDVVRGAHKRSREKAPVVGPTGRGVPWQRLTVSPDGVALGDVLVVGGTVAILEVDNGDGWLSNDDKVLHSVTGRLARGILGDLPDGEIVVRRPKEFRALAGKLKDAGYGSLLPGAFTPEMRRAIMSFQKDHGLPDTGVPDDATLRALDEFLAHMASEEKAAKDSTR